MLKVSVIIPVYNGAKHIASTLDNVLEQSWENIEVIVIDDGSTDNSLEIAKTYENRGVTVLHQQNKGVCAARNLGFRNSTGDYIQFLDADDALDPMKIAHQMILLSGKEGISHCAWSKFHHAIAEAMPVERQVINKTMKPVDWLVAAWNGGEMMQTGCWLTHRAIIDKAGLWAEDIKMNNDGEFFCRAVLQNEIINFSEKALAYYRVPAETNVSQQKSEIAYRSLLDSYISYEQNILAKEDTPVIRAALSNNFYGFLYQVSPQFPELCDEARGHIKNLGVGKPTNIGGKTFKIMSNLLGFRMALALRNRLSTLKH